MGAASAAGRSLTERGVADTLVFATGMCKPGDAAPDWSRHAHPGTAMAFYMSVAQSGQIVTSLLRAGMPAASSLTVAVDVSKTSQVIHETRLDQLTPMLARNDITGCAIIIAVWPKDTALRETLDVRDPERLLA
jgi:uroporphyrin-III C-methyltransferase/precorrin-2 dehydrogenase/sirohydrochlorin ferrochelatase